HRGHFRGHGNALMERLLIICPRCPRKKLKTYICAQKHFATAPTQKLNSSRIRWFKNSGDTGDTGDRTRKRPPGAGFATSCLSPEAIFCPRCPRFLKRRASDDRSGHHRGHHALAAPARRPRDQNLWRAVPAWAARSYRRLSRPGIGAGGETAGWTADAAAGARTWPLGGGRRRGRRGDER